jgi:HD superfamily phosphohydrolase YqeK
VTALESSRRSEQLNAVAKTARALADALHDAGEKTLAALQHDVARAIEAQADRHKDNAKLNFRVLP